MLTYMSWAHTYVYDKKKILAIHVPVIKFKFLLKDTYKYSENAYILTMFYLV